MDRGTKRVHLLDSVHLQSSGLDLIDMYLKPPDLEHHLWIHKEIFLLSTDVHWIKTLFRDYIRFQQRLTPCFVVV